MNNDFILDGNSSIAKKLVQLSEMCPLIIDDEIRNIANQNQSDDPIIQKIIDFDGRAIIPINQPVFSLGKLLYKSAEKLGLSNLIIVSDDKYGWVNLFKDDIDVGLSNEDNPTILACDFENVLCPEFIDQRRDNFLIIDLVNAKSINFEKATILGREFRHVVIIGNPYEKKWSDMNNLMGLKIDNKFGFNDIKSGDGNTRKWWTGFCVSIMANCLYPTAKCNFLRNSTLRREDEIARYGFSKSHPKDIAFLFNVILDFVEDEDHDS